MNLPQYLRVKPRIEQTVEMLVSTTNQLIDYLKEREGDRETTMLIGKKIDEEGKEIYFGKLGKEEKVYIPMEKVNYETQKIDSCTCGGRGARGEHGSPKCSQYGNNDYVSPKKIDVEGLLEEFADLYFEHVVYGAKSERSRQIINQIKDAIK